MSKLHMFLILVLLGSATGALATCGVSGDTIRVENEADWALLADCDSVLGSVFVSNNGFSFLEPMENIVYIEEHFVLDENISLLQLQGLENLRYIGGDFKISTSFSLIDLEKLESIETIGGDFVLNDNFGLDNFLGIETLTSVGGSLILEDNNFFENLDGLDNLASIGGDFILGEGNPNLSNFDGLLALESIGGDLVFEINNFSNLDGFIQLTTVGGDLRIDAQEVLSNIDGLGSLSHVGGHLEITNNPSMPNIDGLFGLETVGEMLTVMGNENLDDCCGIKPFLEQTTLPEAQIMIADNDDDCNSIPEVLACIIENVGEQHRASLEISPNPCKGIFALGGLQEGEWVEIYTFWGLKLHRFKANATTMRVEQILPRGNYLIKHGTAVQFMIVVE